jgi:hypothetical protein
MLFRAKCQSRHLLDIWSNYIYGMGDYGQNTHSVTVWTDNATGQVYGANCCQ